MDPAQIIARSGEIYSAIVNNPFVFLPLIGAWLITAMYFIVNPDEKHGNTYTMSTGIAHVFTAYAISPFAKPDEGWSIGDLRTLVVLILFCYGIILIVLGILRLLPGFLAEFFGDPGHALVPALMAVLYVENNISFDWVTFFVIVIPVAIVSLIKIYRRVRA